MNYSKYVNVFQGTGETEIVRPEGIAARWFFIKAGCGNTSPAATVPFGAMSVSPYSGGYPTGYGDHLPNSHSHPKHFSEGKGLLGFAHIQQSGTGAMGHYYNFVVVTPHYGLKTERVVPENETAEPGYYSCTLGDIKCELTSSAHTAFHRYTFPKGDGKVTVDMKTNGLQCPGFVDGDVETDFFESTKNKADFSFVTQGIKVYVLLESSGDFEMLSDGRLRFSCEKTAELKVAFSLRSCEQAKRYLSETESFDSAKNEAKEKWEKELSKIKVDGFSEGETEIFYSNLYHSLVKPADRKGESFFYDGDGPFSIDLNTLWDMYKTAVPLIFLINREQGEKLTETLLLTGESLGYIPNNIGLTEKCSEHSCQARTLGCYVLLTAYRYGLKIDVKRMLNVIKKDIFADDKKDFTVDGVCGSHTWMLDMADCCALTAEVARENGDSELAELLDPLAAQWRKCYDPETGLLDKNSSYYEGTLYNYSFRQMVNMKERIDIAGGNERFVSLLDRFFGYGAEPVILPVDPDDYAPVEAGMALGRFEGFNNESDTEAPFSYIYAGRHDRTCEIIRSGLKNMFENGRGGLPGNNDTGALSSYYVFGCLGLFPVAGQDLFLIGSPTVKKAEISLYNGKTLQIVADNNSENNIYVSEVYFNGNKLSDFAIKASELLNGGELVFNMTDKSPFCS